MVSMVIVLFLVAILVSLFIGRLAETLVDRYRRRAERQQSHRPLVHRPLVRPVGDMAKNGSI